MDLSFTILKRLTLPNKDKIQTLLMGVFGTSSDGVVQSNGLVQVHGYESIWSSSATAGQLMQKHSGHSK